MRASPYKLAKAWQEVLLLSKVTKDETVCILLRPDIYLENVAAAEFALEQIGATYFSIKPNLAGRSLADMDLLMHVLKSVDVLIDFMGIHGLRQGEQWAIKQAGVRVLYTIEPPDTLLRLMPTLEEKAEVKAAEEKLKASKRMHVTSPYGTDLTAEFGEYAVQAQWGYSDEPGHWDHWPSGFLVRWPNEKSANGTVVLTPGDQVFPFRAYIQSEVRIKIKQGYITAIEGGLDADFIRNYMERFKDPEAFAVSHLGWALSNVADWGALALVDKGRTNGNDARAFRGNFMFSTGPNSDAGGSRHTLCHLDMPMRHCSMTLDNVPILENGRVV